MPSSESAFYTTMGLVNEKSSTREKARDEMDRMDIMDIRDDWDGRGVEKARVRIADAKTAGTDPGHAGRCALGVISGTIRPDEIFTLVSFYRVPEIQVSSTPRKS